MLLHIHPSKITNCKWPQLTKISTGLTRFQYQELWLSWKFNLHCHNTGHSIIIDNPLFFLNYHQLRSHFPSSHSSMISTSPIISSTCHGGQNYSSIEINYLLESFKEIFSVSGTEWDEVLTLHIRYIILIWTKIMLQFRKNSNNLLTEKFKPMIQPVLLMLGKQNMLIVWLLKKNDQQE